MLPLPFYLEWVHCGAYLWLPLWSSVPEAAMPSSEVNFFSSDLKTDAPSRIGGWVGGYFKLTSGWRKCGTGVRQWSTKQSSRGLDWGQI